MRKGTHQGIRSVPEQQQFVQGCQSSQIGKQMKKKKKQTLCTRHDSK